MMVSSPPVIQTLGGELLAASLLCGAMNRYNETGSTIL
jgi:hypothetical protein